MVWSGCPDTDSIVVMMLVRAPLLLLLLHGAGRFIVILPPWSAYPRYMPDLPSDPPIGGCFTGVVGGHDTVAGVTVVFGLFRFCLVHAGFYKVLVRSCFIAGVLGR
jgi:hypothetical protein